MQGKPWLAWEWLYELLLGILHRACGLNGVVWLCALLVAAVLTLLLSQLLRRGTGLLLAVVLMLLAEAASAIHLYARPHIASWLLTLGWFVVLEKWELWNQQKQGRVPRWIPCFFPASILLWVNLHGGWLFGLALLGIYVASAWLESLRAPDPFAAVRISQRARAMTVAWVASIAATLVNPFGWRLHVHIYRYLTDHYLINHIDEFRSPNFHGWAERSFAIILVLVLIAFAGKTTVRLELRLSNLLVVLLAAYAGFYSSRNLPVSAMLLVLIAGPILGRSIDGIGESPGASQSLRRAIAGITNYSDRMAALERQLRGHLWPLASVVLAFAICLNGGWLGSRQLIHADFDPNKVPVAAVTLLESAMGRELAGVGPVFSTDTWGGYLIYRMYPQRKVVIDDRHDFYGSDRVRQYLILTQGENGWQSVLKDWQIRTALLPADSTLTNLLLELPQDWQMVYEDKVAVVFVKR
jgi:hypothetical protein